MCGSKFCFLSAYSFHMIYIYIPVIKTSYKYFLLLLIWAFFLIFPALAQEDEKENIASQNQSRLQHKETSKSILAGYLTHRIMGITIRRIWRVFHTDRGKYPLLTMIRMYYEIPGYGWQKTGPLIVVRGKWDGTIFRRSVAFMNLVTK